MKDLEDLLSLKGEDPKTKLIRGEALFRLGRKQEALEELKGVDMMEAFLLRYEVLEELGRREEAEDEIRRGVEEFPYNYYLRFLLAKVKEEKGDMEGALEEVDKGLEIMPFNLDFLTLKARVLFSMERYEDALMVTSDIVRKKPDDVEVRKMRVMSYYLMGSLYDALMEVNMALDYSKDPYLHFLKGRIYHDMRHYKLALDEFKIAIHMDRRGEYLYAASLSCYSLKMYQESLKFVDEALSFEGRPLYLSMKARVMKQLGMVGWRDIALRAIQEDPSLRSSLSDVLEN